MLCLCSRRREGGCFFAFLTTSTLLKISAAARAGREVDGGGEAGPKKSPVFSWRRGRFLSGGR